jgi:hypothetical protein
MPARLKILTSVLTLVLVCSSSLAARQDVTLRYRWTKGDTLRYRITQQSTTTIGGIPGMDNLTIEQSIVQVVSTSVDDVAADGAATLKQSVESVKMDLTSPVFAASYDSAKPEAATDQLSATLKGVLSQVIGQSYTVVMGPTGEVLKVEGVSKMAEKMFSNVSADPAAAGVLDGLKAGLSDDSMRSLLAQSFSQSPNRPLKVGESWTYDVVQKNPMLGGIITSVKMTLKSVDGEASKRVATIATASDVKQDAAAPPAPNPMGMTMKLSPGTGDGEQVFDVAAGRLTRATIRMSMPMSMSGAGPDGSPMNLTTIVKGTTTTELIQ